MNDEKIKRMKCQCSERHYGKLDENQNEVYHFSFQVPYLKEHILGGEI